MNIEWLVFDLGGVVVEINREHPVNELARTTSLDQATLRSLFLEDFADPNKMDSIANRYQLGQLTTAEALRDMGKHLQFGDYAKIAEASLGVLQGERQETLALLEDLAKHFNLACFSNTCALHWDHMQENFKCFDLFKQQFASHLLQQAKPHAGAFQTVAARLGVRPENCLLIDDMAVNVSGAKQAGWHAIQFENVTKLKTDLPTAIKERIGAKENS